MKPALERTLISTKFAYAILFVCCFLHAGCGGDAGKAEGRDADASALQISMHWETPGRSDAGRATHSPSGNICADYAIEEIGIKLYDASHREVTSANWKCSRGHGTLSGITPASGLWLTVDAMVAGRADWHCQSEPFDVGAGEVTQVSATMRYVGEDSSPPDVAGFDPAESATGVLLESVISVTFSEEIVPGSLTAATFMLQAGGAPINGAIDYDPTTRTATFTPESILSPATEYTAVLTAAIEDRAGIQLPAEFNWRFTTIAYPAAITEAAGNLMAHEAILNGRVNPNGGSTTWHFEYGADENYGAKTAPADAGAGSDSLPVSVPLSGLSPGNTYHFRVVAVNGEGVGHGADMTFTTAHAVWVSAGGTVSKVSSAREELLTLDRINCRNLSGISQFDIDPYDGSLWIADTNENRVIKLDENGGLILLLDQYSASGAAVDPRDGSLWTSEYISGESRKLIKRNALGLAVLNTEKGLTVSSIDNGLAWDADDNSLWMADYQTNVIKLFGVDSQLRGYDLSGPSGVNHLRIGGFDGQPFTVSVYPGTGGYVWASDRHTKVIQFSRSGSVNVSFTPLGFSQVRTVSTDITDGSVWAGGVSRVAKYSAGGDMLINVGAGQSIDALEADFYDGGVWVGDRSGGLIKLSATGAEQWRRGPAGVDAIALVLPKASTRKIHVSGDGSDNDGDGTPGKPYQTIGKGIGMAGDGDSVVVAVGTYNENVTLKSGVKILGAGADVTTIRGLGNTHVVDGTGVNRATLSGFTITGSGDISAGVYCVGCQGLIIRQNSIIRNGGGSYGGTGILVQGDSSVLIEHDRVLENEQTGVSIGGNSYAIIRNNIIARNGDNGIGNSSRGFCHIANNVIDSNATGSSGRSGIMTSGNDVIINNIISNNGNDNPNAGLSVGIYANEMEGIHSLWNNNVYNNFQGPYTGISAGAGDINADPRYTNPAVGDYSLQAGSPSINTGNPDLHDDGIECGQIDSRSDMGAYGGPWGFW